MPGRRGLGRLQKKRVLPDVDLIRDTRFLLMTMLIVLKMRRRAERHGTANGHGTVFMLMSARGRTVARGNPAFLNSRFKLSRVAVRRQLPLCHFDEFAVDWAVSMVGE